MIQKKQRFIKVSQKKNVKFINCTRNEFNQLLIKECKFNQAQSQRKKNHHINVQNLNCAKNDRKNMNFVKEPLKKKVLSKSLRKNKSMEIISREFYQKIVVGG